MTKYIYHSQADANFIGNSFSYVAKIILGSKHGKKCFLNERSI